MNYTHQAVAILLIASVLGGMPAVVNARSSQRTQRVMIWKNFFSTRKYGRLSKNPNSDQPGSAIANNCSLST